MNAYPNDPTSVDELPDNPMAMPPPYWRSSGAIFHIKDALADIERRLKRLTVLLIQRDVEITAFNKRHRTKIAREAAEEERLEIELRPFMTEHRIKLAAEVACLMSAIEAEDRVNCFCVFNLHKNIAEGIEKLSLPEKLSIACTAVGSPEIRGTAIFQSTRKLVAWRNAFAHGHCVDRPTKSLRHNHLISPSEYPSVPSAIQDVKAMVGAYLDLSEYLRSKSINEYLRDVSIDDEDVRRALIRLSKYTFEGSNQAYSIHTPFASKS